MLLLLKRSNSIGAIRLWSGRDIHNLPLLKEMIIRSSVVIEEELLLLLLLLWHVKR